ncbi:D-aspartate oxidase-like protein, partial [Leptotrombidium deliense]
MKRVVIVGGGIIGFSCALNIVQKLTNVVSVTLITEKCSPETTSDVAAGIVYPYLCGDIPTEKLNKWVKDSTDHFLSLLNSTIASEVGVNLISGYALYEKNIIDEKMFETLISSRKMSDKELKLFSKSNDTFDGYFQTTLTVEATKLLPYYQKLFIEKGGTIRVQKVHKLEHLVDEFDVIVNCTGIGAREFVSDSTVYPIRGQVM